MNVCICGKIWEGRMKIFHCQKKILIFAIVLSDSSDSSTAAVDEITEEIGGNSYHGKNSQS